jgi:chromate transporter
MEGLDLGALFLQFLLLWVLAIGGPSTIFPDIHRYVVEAHHLLTGEQFAEIYTVAQVAPGPNAMYVTLIGWYLAGWKGVIATTIPLLIPATTPFHPARYQPINVTYMAFGPGATCATV